MSDTTVKLSGTYDSIEAYNILEEMQEMGTNYTSIYNKAVLAETTAETAITTAQTAVNTATSKAGEASTYADNANTFANNASASEANALTYSTNAKTSETNASTSEANAKTSETNAKTSEENTIAKAEEFASSIEALSSGIADEASARESADSTLQSNIDGKLSLSGGTMSGNISFDNGAIRSNETYVELYSYNGTDIGSCFVAYRSDDETNKGTLLLKATDGTNSTFFRVYADGNAKIGSKLVENVVASGTNYIRYYSGLQICWGNYSNSSASGVSVSYALSFNSTPTVCATCGYPTDTSSLNYIVLATAISTSSCKCYVRNSNGILSADGVYIHWIAIGKWK